MMIIWMEEQCIRHIRPKNSSEMVRQEMEWTKLPSFHQGNWCLEGLTQGKWKKVRTGRTTRQFLIH